MYSQHTEVDTYWASIFVGFKNSETEEIHSIDEVRKICSDYVNEIGLCVTITPTEYVYSDFKTMDYRGETGAIVGLINYPRFPSSPKSIRKCAIDLAEDLKEKLEQHRVTVQFPDDTVMLGEHG